jgi:membrane associated rhomboid family serine protease
LQGEILNKQSSKEGLVKLKGSLLIPLGFAVFIWIVHIVQSAYNFPFAHFGILPRSFIGIAGILSAPLIHADFSHLISNTPTLIILGVAVMYFYPDSSLKVFAMLYLLTGLFVWLFARQVFHVGASGIIYGLLGFLFFSGIIRRDSRAIALSLLITFIYGGLIWGVLPGAKGISWESHLFGGLTGILAAFIFRKEDPYIKYDWEREEEENGAAE